MNRRAFTSSPVRDNRIFSIYVVRNGYASEQQAHYYRRHLRNGNVFTGRYEDAQ